jgi:hypothetical protein
MNPPLSARRLYDAAPGPKQLALIPGGGHEDSAEVNPTAYFAALNGFLVALRFQTRGRHFKVTMIRPRFRAAFQSPYRARLTRHPDLIAVVNLLMQWESRRQRRLEMDWFSGDGVVEFQKLGVQKISSIAGEAGEIFKRLAG